MDVDRAVVVGCVCPGTPHATDTVTLRPELDFRQAARVRNAAALLDEDERLDGATVLAVLQEQYVLVGVESWTLEADGQPVPVTPQAVQRYLLSHPLQAGLVADVADELYNDVVTAPLLARAARQFGTGPTDVSTSATNGSQPATPMPSRPSLTFTTLTDDIEPVPA